jgi:glycosyltransferase involved in cell wall biosynthesis
MPDKSTKPHGVSVVIPAYNEENGIQPVLASLRDTMEQTGMDFEILVVDDGSEDKTGSVAEAASARVVHHKENRGYGASLKTGIRNAHFDTICITDADGTYPHAVIPDMIARIENNTCDMIVASRTGKHVAIPLIRRPAKWVIGQLANIVAGTRIPDINSGLRVFRRADALQFFNLLPSGFSFTTTITLAMMSNDYRVDYLPIDYFQRVGRSKIRPIRDTLNFVQLILRIALYFEPLKIFLPLSGVLILLAVAWGVYSRLILGKLADVSTIVITMTAVQVMVVGLLAELVNRRLPNFYREES